MKKRSFFFKEYLTHFILIVVAFTLAGSVFYHQMASYALRAKQTELKTTVQSLAEQSKLMQGTDSDVIRELYMLSIARIAKEDELPRCWRSSPEWRTAKRGRDPFRSASGLPARQRADRLRPSRR